MSQWRGQFEDIEEPGDLAQLVERYYHVPTVLALIVFMLWSRVRDWKNFVVDGSVYFGGFDPWYHYRMTSYTVRHWPETSTFDPWTYFPYGVHSSQFGTIFDQLMATAALVVGLGNPSDHTVRMVVLFTPAVIGALTAIPVYYLGKETAGRLAGVVAVGVIALFGSLFVQRGTVGFADHHIAEVFFQTVAILATVVALSVAETEKPVWELFEARDAAALRRPVGWAVVAGAATAVYIWTWPPGVFLVGILGVYYLLELGFLQAHGESPEPIAIVGAVSMATTGVLTLAVFEELTLSATSFNLVQPGLAFAVAAGCAFMAWLAREWEARELPDYQYPIAVLGLVAVLAGATAVILPSTFDFVVSQVMRVVGLSTTDTAGTVGEAQSLPFSQLWPMYRFTLLFALLGVFYVFARQFLTKTRSELLLLAVWTTFMLFATLTQRRFDYYFGVSVAVMTGYVVATVADFGDLSGAVDELDTYQVVSIVAIVVVVFAPLVVTSTGVLALGQSSTAAGQEPVVWNETMGWMAGNTPAEGNLGGAGNDMPYYGQFQSTDDFDYEAGFYGVMSWWDYGHYITTMSERIPNANPFQLGANEAANFLLSSSEAEANEELADLRDGDGTETRYVVVDWKMATTEQRIWTGQGYQSLGGKYFAPFAFYDDGEISQRSHYEPIYYRVGQGNQGFYRAFHQQKQPYYNSTAVRLYQFHGSSVSPQPVVLDWEIRSINDQQARVSQGLKTNFSSMSAARAYVRNDTTSQIGGVGKYPEERVPAMEHYRLVGASDRSALSSRRYPAALNKVSRGAFQQSIAGGSTGFNGQLLGQLHATSPDWIKVFERVPGGTIQGQGPPNATITASVQMHKPASNTTFPYRQQVTTDANGEFTMTVPYSTTGYDEWGTESGYTNVSVRATGPYQFQTGFLTNESGYVYRYSGQANVTEGQVIGEDDSPATATLERQVFNSPSNETNAGNESTPGNQTTPDSETTPAPTNGTADDESSNGATGDDAADGTPDGDAPTATPSDSTPSDSPPTESPSSESTAEESTPTESTPTATATAAGNVDGQQSLGAFLVVAAPLVGVPVLGVTLRRRS